MALGWLLGTTLALWLTALSSSELHRGVWHDSVYFIQIAPIWLTLWEFPLAFILFHSAIKNLNVSLRKALLWSLSAVPAVLLTTLSLGFIYIIFTPYVFVVAEIIWGLLQGWLLHPFVRRPWQWGAIRAVAFLGGVLAGGLISIGDLPTSVQAIKMGCVGGLIKGTGLMFYIEPRMSSTNSP